MRRLLFIRSATFLTVVMALTGVALGQAIPTGAAEPARQARLTNEERRFDFGRVFNTGQVTRVFILGNDGKMPLVIHRIQAGCGCTEAKADPMTVPPGEKSRLTVRFTLVGRTGPQRKSVYVHCNDPTRPIVQFELVGEALAVTGGPDPVRVSVEAGKFRIEPKKVDFGELGIWDTAAGEIVLSGGCTGQPLRLPDVSADVSNLVATVYPISGEQNGVRLRLLPPHGIGPGAALIRIRTDQAAIPEVDVPVIWVGRGDLYAMPEELAFVVVEGQTNTACRYIAVRSRRDKPFGIKRVELPAPGMKAEWEPIPTGGYRCAVRNIVPGQALNGRNIVIVTDQVGESRLSIPIRVVEKNGLAGAGATRRDD